MKDKMLIRGGKPLNGIVDAQGAKNAALPVMAAAILLRGGSLKLEKVPDLNDIHTMSELLRQLGASVSFENNSMTIDVPDELAWDTPAELVRMMRASSLVLGPLVARCGKAVLPLPGGCVLGSRPIDFHLKGLSKMGASIDLQHGAVHAAADHLSGAAITLDFPSVGATENLMMAATLAKGTTYIENAAKEPEIVNLADVLRLMGAQIEGDGTSAVKITGRPSLRSASGKIIPDRIESATYLLVGAITRGTVTVRGIDSLLLDSILNKMAEAGICVDVSGDEITAGFGGRLDGITVKTLPYPGFPTDAQPQIMALLSTASGTSVIHESVFDSRLMHIEEFKKMGAKIEVQDCTAVITGVSGLTGAEVYASNLRAGAALIMLGLAADGTTKVCGLKHVWRGYELMPEKLRALGADLELED